MRWDEEMDRDFAPGGSGEKLLAEVDADIRAGKSTPIRCHRNDSCPQCPVAPSEHSRLIRYCVMWRLALRFALAVFLAAVSFAKDKPTYTEHGTIVAMKTERVVSGTPVYTDPYGKTHGGVVGTHRVPVFTIRTATIDYEVEGRQALSIDQEVDFRIDKRRVYIRRGDKEDRYALVGEEKR